jgi:hypothetical protein
MIERRIYLEDEDRAAVEGWLVAAVDACFAERLSLGLEPPDAVEVLAALTTVYAAVARHAPPAPPPRAQH